MPETKITEHATLPLKSVVAIVFFFCAVTASYIETRLAVADVGRRVDAVPTEIKMMVDARFTQEWGRFASYMAAFSQLNHLPLPPLPATLYSSSANEHTNTGGSP